MLFQSLLIFIEKCVIILLSERSDVMRFIVCAVYKNSEGKQVAWDIQSEQGLKRRCTSTDELCHWFATGLCLNAVLVKHSFVRRKSGDVVRYSCQRVPYRRSGCEGQNKVHARVSPIHCGDEISQTRLSKGSQPFLGTQGSAAYQLRAGSELKNFVAACDVQKLRHRDFVFDIKSFRTSSYFRVMGISGLRGSGKTMGMLQAIADLNDYSHIAYIEILDSMTCAELMGVLSHLPSGISLIFIDEITKVMDLITNSAFLCDVFADKRFVICGTDSLSLLKTRSSALHHRVLFVETSFIDFVEAQRTMGVSLRQYLEIGGLYTASYFSDVAGVREYLNTSVVDNIMHTIANAKWCNWKRVGGRETEKGSVVDIANGYLDNATSAELRKIVFLIVYSVIFKDLSKHTGNVAGRLVNLFDLSYTTAYTAQSINELVCATFNFDPTMKISKPVFFEVVDLLVELGLLIKVGNIADSQDFNYYLTNQCVANVLLSEVISAIKQGTGLKTTDAAKRVGIKAQRGVLLESLLMAHASRFCKKHGYRLYYYRDKLGREVDMIVATESDDWDTKLILREIKMTSDVDTAVVKSIWINDDGVNNSLGGENKVISRGIIYTGKSDKFEASSTSDVYGTKSKTKEQLEIENAGIRLFSAEEFFKNSDEYLRFTDEEILGDRSNV